MIKRSDGAFYANRVVIHVVEIDPKIQGRHLRSIWTQHQFPNVTQNTTPRGTVTSIARWYISEWPIRNLSEHILDGLISLRCLKCHYTFKRSLERVTTQFLQVMSPCCRQRTRHTIRCPVFECACPDAHEKIHLSSNLSMDPVTSMLERGHQIPNHHCRTQMCNNHLQHRPSHFSVHPTWIHAPRLFVFSGSVSLTMVKLKCTVTLFQFFETR